MTNSEISWFLSAVNPDNPNFSYDFKISREMLASLKAMMERAIGHSDIDVMVDHSTLSYTDEQLKPRLAEGQQYVSNYKSYGYLHWYDFCVANWGSKWNSYEAEPFVDDTISFQTAWSSVLPVIAKLADRFPAVRISYSWADEAFGMNLGTAVFEHGRQTELYRPDAYTKEAFELAAEVLYGCSPIEMGMVFDEKTQNYVEADEEEDLAIELNE